MATDGISALPKDREEFTISFDGDLAGQGILHFYEYGRSQYATARFIAVIERFRRDGFVLNRVSSANYVNIFVETPKRGSFIETVLVPIGTGAMGNVLAVPLIALVSYVWFQLVPRKESTDTVLLEMAKIRLAEKQQRTLQVQATAQAQTAQIVELAKIVKEQQITTRQALSLLEWARDSRNTALGRIGVDQPRNVASDKGNAH